jgi:lysozyme
MNLSRTMATLRRHEGLRLKVYQCPAGKWTIGYGRNLEDTGISFEEAGAMLLNDCMKIDERLLERYSWYRDLNERRQEVIVNMVYNLGHSGFAKFKNMIRALEERNYRNAADEMLDSKWARQVGDRAKELSNTMKNGV